MPGAALGAPDPRLACLRAVVWDWLPAPGSSGEVQGTGTQSGLRLSRSACVLEPPPALNCVLRYVSSHHVLLGVFSGPQTPFFMRTYLHGLEHPFVCVQLYNSGLNFTACSQHDLLRKGYSM